MQGMTGYKSGSLRSESAFSKDIGSKPLCGANATSWTENRLRVDQDQGRFSRIIDPVYQWLFAVITMSNKFYVRRMAEKQTS